MVNSTNPVTPSPAETPALTLQTAGLVAAMAKVHVDTATGQQAVARNEFHRQFTNLFEQTGAKTVNINLPDGRKVGTASFDENKDSTKLLNEDEFLKWVMEHDEWEHEVETIVRVQPAFQARLLKEVIWTVVTDRVPVLDDDDQPVLDADGKPTFNDVPVLDDAGQQTYQAVHRETGELVPGLRLDKGGVNTSKFSIRLDRPKAGSAAVEGVVRDGAALIADYMASNPIESIMPASLDAPVVNGK